jgi:hypothetical protein
MPSRSIFFRDDMGGEVRDIRMMELGLEVLMLMSHYCAGLAKFAERRI